MKIFRDKTVTGQNRTSERILHDLNDKQLIALDAKKEVKNHFYAKKLKKRFCLYNDEFLCF